MIKKILFQHLHERGDCLSKEYIERLSSEKTATLLTTSLIKIIMGPRRAGKSVLGFLLLKDKNFAYVNFDDDLLLKNYEEDSFVEALHQVYGTFEYVFFDEIQNIPNWELLVNKLYRRNYNIILTGSNSRLLSKELADALTGRFVTIEVFPFSFAEYCKYKNNLPNSGENYTPAQKGDILASAFSYLSTGGFPECIKMPAIQKTYLSALFDSVLYKDLVKRFNIRNTEQLNDLAVYLLNNFSNPYTYNSICETLNFNSVASVQKYIRLLEEPYLFFSLSQFSFKFSVRKKAAKKVYTVDNGFINARSFEFSPNYGRLLENLVFLELIRRGYKPDLSLFYYQTRNKLEIDFVLKKDISIDALIQVAYDVSDPKTFKRETNALLSARKEVSAKKLMLVTWDEEREFQHEETIVLIIPFWKFALSPDYL